MAVAKHTHKSIWTGAIRTNPLAVCIRLLRNCCLYCLALSLWPVLGISQTYTQTIQTDNLVYNLKLWAYKDGVPRRKFGGGFQDNRGTTWLAWQNSLYRFDGHKLEQVWQNRDKLYDFNSSMFAEDSRHNIWWLRSNYGNPVTNIHVYSPGQEKLYPLEEYLGEAAEELPERVCLRIFSLNQTVYINSTCSGSLWQYDGGKLTQIYTPSEQADAYSIPFPAPKGHTWIVSRDKGVLLRNPDGNVVVQHTGLGISEYGFALDQDYQLYYHSVRDGLQRLTLPDSLRPPASSGSANKVLVDLFKNFYEIPNTDAYLYKKRGKSTPVMANGATLIEDLETFLEERVPSLKLNLSKIPNCSLLKLDDGTLFFPTTDRGLLQLQIKPNYFQPLMKDHYIRGLEVSGDRLYAKSSGSQAGLYEVDLSDHTCRQLRAAEESAQFYSLSIHGEQAFIGFSDGRLLQASPDLKTDQRIFNMPGDSLKPGMEVRCILPRPDSLIWYGCLPGLLEADLRSGQSRLLLKGANINCLHEDKAGVAWAGTNRGILNIAERTYYLDTLPDGSPLTVAHIYEQDAQNFWLSTQQGLIRWTPYTNDYDHYTEADGLSNNFLHAVYPDQSGRLWISSNNGIMYFDLETAEIVPYFESDGLCSDEQNLIAHTQSADGRLYFGSLEGINGFHPDSIPHALPRMDKRPYIEKFRLYNAAGVAIQAMSYPEEEELLTLPRACKQLSIELSQPYYGFQGLNIEWRVPSQNESWQRVNENNQVFLLSLPDGDFEVELRAWTRKTKNHPAVTTLHFHTPYPMYLLPAFWVGVVLLTAILFILIYRWRTSAIRTNNRRLNEEVRKRTQELEQQKQKILEQKRRLERVDEAKNRLFDSISHELRSPLTLIQVSAGQLLENKTTNLKQIAGRIKKQSLKMTHMIEDIMDLSKMELGLLQRGQSAVNWNKLVRDQFSMLESLARQKNHTYQLYLAPDEDTVVQTDPQKAETVLSNLLHNAIKYTPAGGHITVHSKVGHSEVTVAIKDNGPGILPEEQQDIFKRYYQGQASKSGAQPGYGIGLALCKEYVEFMGGQIAVESKPGQGTTIKFRLPTGRSYGKNIVVHEPPVPSVITPPPFAKGNRDGKPWILIAEDNTELQQLLWEVLSGSYSVQFADNGQEAFELLQASPAKYELVVSDIIMPVLDGYELLMKTRSHPKLGFLPFIMLTALSSDHDKIKGLRLGVDAFLTKPFDTTELTLQIGNLISNQQLRRAHLQKQTGENPSIKPDNKAGTEDDTESYDEAWLQELEAVVRRHISEFDFKVTNLAFELHISERTLRNYIKTYTGLTPSAYLQKARLDRAHLYLKSHKYRTVREVAYEVGFKDARYFSKLFKQAFGKSPSTYL